MLDILCCPNCHGPFVEKGDALSCKRCNSLFGRNTYSFFEFVVDKNIYEIDSTSEAYAKDQETYPIRLYKEFLKSLLAQEPFERILDVGCGVGKVTSMLLEDGRDAYGIDIPLSEHLCQQLATIFTKQFPKPIYAGRNKKVKRMLRYWFVMCSGLDVCVVLHKLSRLLLPMALS